MSEPLVRDVYGIIHAVYFRSSAHKTWTWCQVCELFEDLRADEGVVTCLMCAAIV